MISAYVHKSLLPIWFLVAQQSDRSRGFGFIQMATVEDATRCIQELNGVVSGFVFSLPASG